MTQFLFRRAEFDMRKSTEVEWYMYYVPGIINSILITIFDKLNDFVSVKLVKSENHRYQDHLENSMINKTYIFKFVNTYISCFVIIFIHQDYKLLQLNVITIMVFKQILSVLVEYLLLKCSVGRKINKIN